MLKNNHHIIQSKINNYSNLPLVTVITPTYNRAEYLIETIESILSQDYSNFEYIVLDDGSNDNTLDILKKYSGKISWESHPNMGETRTVNKGYCKAKGKYIGIVNSDDLLLPGAISAAVKTFTEDPSILVAYPGWSYIDENSTLLYEELVPKFNYEEMVRKHWCVVGPGAFISRRVFDFTYMRDENLKYVADFEYWLRLGLYGSFKRIPGVYGTFRIHKSSASVQMKNVEMAKEHIKMMSRYYSMDQVPKKLKSGRYFHESWSRTYLHAARTCPPKGLNAYIYYLKSIIIYPPTIKYIVFSKINSLIGTLKIKLVSKYFHLKS